MLLIKNLGIEHLNQKTKNEDLDLLNPRTIITWCVILVIKFPLSILNYLN